jgi:hypothetical protein
MQKKSIPFILLTFLTVFFVTVFCSFNKIHPFYLSVTEIRADTSSKIISISCRMFTDDLQDALYKLHDMREEILPGIENDSVKLVLAEYLKKRLRIISLREEIPLKFLGYEAEEEATWCYLEGRLTSGDSKFHVKNTLLFDFIAGQSNMIHFYFQKERKSAKLNNPESTFTFDFN